MKKLKIRPYHFLYIIFLTISLLMVIVGIGVVVAFLVKAKYDIFSLAVTVCGLGISAMFLAIFILELKKCIEFKEKSIYVAADPADKRGALLRRLQYETTIQYDEIQIIRYAAAATDSLGRSVEGVFLPMVYIVFECKDGKEKAINAHFYTKKQTVQIIDEAKRRAAAVGNELNIGSGEVLLKEFLEKAKYSRKRKK